MCFKGEDRCWAESARTPGGHRFLVSALKVEPKFGQPTAESKKPYARKGSKYKKRIEKEIKFQQTEMYRKNLAIRKKSFARLVREISC